MQKLLISTIFLMSIQLASCQQPINWQKTSNWRLYHIKSRQVFKATNDTLSALHYISLGQDTIMRFIKQAAPLQSEHDPTWMGAWLASCQLEDGSTRRFAISQYGGFFWDEKDKRYYTLPDAIQNDWLNFISDQYEKITLFTH